MFESTISVWFMEKLLVSGKFDANISSWSYDMEGHANECVKRCWGFSNDTFQQFNKVATPCMDDHQCKEEEIGSVGELSTVCSHIVLKCLYLARIGRIVFLCYVNKIVRAVTKARDKRPARRISYIHHTCEFSQYCYVRNTAQQ